MKIKSILRLSIVFILLSFGRGIMNMEEESRRAPLESVTSQPRNRHILISANAHQEELLDAVVNGGKVKIEKIDSHLDEYHEYTGLHLAAFLGNAQMVDTLIRKGASVSKRDKHGCTALHLAAARGHLNTVRVLVQNGASDRDTISYGTALTMAFKNGHIAIARMLLAKEVVPPFSPFENLTPSSNLLESVANDGRINEVRWLIYYGASCHGLRLSEIGKATLKNAFKNPLLNAIVSGDIASAYALLDGLGKEDSVNKKLMGNALILAAAQGHKSLVNQIIEIFKGLVSQYYIGQALIHATVAEHPDVVASLLLRLDVALPKGQDALKKAFRVSVPCADSGIISLLWSRRDASDKTWFKILVETLQSAIDYGSKSVVAFLLREILRQPYTSAAEQYSTMEKIAGYKKALTNMYFMSDSNFMSESIRSKIHELLIAYLNAQKVLLVSRMVADRGEALFPNELSVELQDLVVRFAGNALSQEK